MLTIIKSLVELLYLVEQLCYWVSVNCMLVFLKSEIGSSVGMGDGKKK